MHVRRLTASAEQAQALDEELVEAVDWDNLLASLHSKEAAAVMDFVHRYGLGLKAGNALLQLLQQVRCMHPGTFYTLANHICYSH